MEREEFKKFVKMIRDVGLLCYGGNDYFKFIHHDHVYMVVDTQPDYLDDESLKIMEDEGLMGSGGSLKEPDINKSGFTKLLLTLDHLSKYKKRMEGEVNFVIGKVDNRIVIGHVDSSDDIFSDTKVEALENIDGPDGVTIFDSDMINNVISFLGFFKYEGISSGFITLHFKEDMPLIIDKDRFRIYVAPIVLEYSDSVNIIKKIKDYVAHGVNNVSQFEEEE